MICLCRDFNAFRSYRVYNILKHKEIFVFFWLIGKMTMKKSHTRMLVTTLNQREPSARPLAAESKENYESR